MNEVKLPHNCLCTRCPHYNECLTLSRKVFQASKQQKIKLVGVNRILKERNIDPQVRQELLQAIEAELKKDPFKVIMGFGGLVLGCIFADWLRKNYDWLRKNYSPKRRRRRFP